MVRENPARRLDKRIWFSLSLSAGLVILHQFLIQPSLVQLTSDAPVINLAGRQRMLSQKLVKEALAFVATTENTTRELRRGEFAETLETWRSAHLQLRRTTVERGLSTNPELDSGYRRLEPLFQAMNDAGIKLLASHDSHAQQSALEGLLLNEPEFLKEMHSLVGVYEDQARTHVRQLQGLGFVIMVGILGTLLLVQFGVMRPELNSVGKAWEKSEANYELLVESMTDGLVVLDANGRIEFANRRLGEMLGQESEVFIGRSLSEFVAAIDQPTYQRLLAIDESPQSADIKFVRFEGGEVETSISPQRMSRIQGDPPRLLLVITDTTIRKQIERRSQDLQTQLVHANRLKSMGTMAAALAHEINQPLGAISNYAEGCLTRLTGASPDPRELVSPLRAILQASLRGGEIVRRTRNFSRRRPFRLAPESLNELVREIDELCRPEARRRSVVLELDLDDTLPDMAADGIQIQQVLVILIENAFNALDHREPSQRKITLTTRARPIDEIEVSVKDSGPGLMPDTLKSLFEPFVTTEVNGTGLGLTIARGIIEAHGGKIWHEPNDAGGAEFRFTLPILAESPGSDQTGRKAQPPTPLDVSEAVDADLLETSLLGNQPLPSDIQNVCTSVASTQRDRT
ncbi:ATP-binding protein [Schlesneria sp. T3-172]|uniref:ATP-binding protein n=1 Tax=Schlesneria sphaerica TaxID=3373610 RepID=UPI0037C68BBE